ncbi:MAG TPA: molybdopterin-dependent oxidoreductase [Propionibacteriaceae bacterium]|nr:molybdopterin-dependent oxidoreductase [Propionibacteriaceae bacterium]
MTRLAAAVVGITSAALGLAAGHLLASLVGPASSPVVAVGATVVDLVPAWLKEFAIAAFGTADKTVLLGTVLFVLAAASAGLGVLALKSRRLALTGVLALGALAGIAALTRPSAGMLAALPSLATIAVAWIALTGQLGRLAPPHATPQPTVDRRRFLVTTGGTLAGAGLLAALGDVLKRPPSEPLALPPNPTPSPPLPGALDATVPGITPLRTPTGEFYRIDTALSLPRVDPSTWRLQIDGMVAEPYSLTMDELLALPLVERDITLTCVSNEIGGNLCGSTRWRGVLVADLIRRAKPDAAADQVLSRSIDGFTASTPIDVMLDGRDAMIALTMDGEPLNAEHGAPARLVTPGLYGYVGATKWLTRLTVTTFEAEPAYWTRRGWSERGPVKTATRIDTPRGDIASGTVAIGGVAWATHRGVTAVQVSIDEGPWVDATLGLDVGVDYWRQWYLPWDATPGEHRIAARAIDGTGDVQTDEVRDVIPDGATGHHIVTVTVA